MGEGRKRKLSAAVERAVADEAALVLDTFGGKLHVKFDHTASVTMLGQLPFFAGSTACVALASVAVMRTGVVMRVPLKYRFR